jgi:hypothetical protein
MLPCPKTCVPGGSHPGRPDWQVPGWSVAAGISTIAAMAGLLAGGWPWGAVCGLVLGGLGGWAGWAAWKTMAWPSVPGAPPLPDDASTQPPVQPARPACEARASAQTPLFDATRPIPPLDPNLLALSSADLLTRQIREDTRRFRQAAEAD